MAWKDFFRKKKPEPEPEPKREPLPPVDLTIGGVKFTLSEEGSFGHMALSFDPQPQNVIVARCLDDLLTKRLGHEKLRYHADVRAIDSGKILFDMNTTQWKGMPQLTPEMLTGILREFTKIYPDEQSLLQATMYANAGAMAAKEGQRTTEASRTIKPYFNAVVKTLEENGVDVSEELQEALKTALTEVELGKRGRQK